MLELLSALGKTPVSVILIVAGLIFLAFAILQISINVRTVKTAAPTSGRQIVSGIVGAIMVVTGVYLSLKSSPPEAPAATGTPALSTTELPATSTRQPEIVTLPPSPIPVITETTPTVQVRQTIAISEVMASPCGAGAGPDKNEYIELYNWGDSAIDVAGWYIGVTGDGEGTPDQLTTWDNRNPGVSLGNNPVINSSTIPPRGFAVILSPRYYLAAGRYNMPYFFPNGTIILTIARGNALGNDNTGLLGLTQPLTGILLYQGSDSIIDTPISTYGAPIYGSSVSSIIHNNSGDFPYYVRECSSMEKIIPSAADAKSNWRPILNGNPGSGDYSP